MVIISFQAFTGVLEMSVRRNGLLSQLLSSSCDILEPVTFSTGDVLNPPWVLLN